MKIISEKTSKRVCNHMNKDHIDSVHKYLIHIASINNFKEAEMVELNNKYMKIRYDDKYALIKFKKEISEDQIHDTLVSMIKEIEDKNE